MQQRTRFIFGAIGLLLALLACNSADLLTRNSLPTPTPTFVLAQFKTPTATPAPADPPAVEPTGTATVPPAATNPPTSTPTEAAKPESTAEEPAEAAAETSFDSPVATPTPAATETPAATPTATSPPPPPTETPPPAPTATPAPLGGRIAFPVDDGGGHYDVWVVELPDGEPFLVQARARQPNFSKDGRLIVNHQNSQFGESLGVIGVDYDWQGIVNNSPDDAYPFWKPDGTVYTYSNPKLLLDPANNNPLPTVFIPCSMQLPSLEGNPKCQDIRTFGKVAVGEAPVWTDDDRIAFFSFQGDDGIYVVSSVSALWEAGGTGPKNLLVTGNGRPSDTAGFQVFFSAGDIDGNWEAYAIDLDGTNLTNLSNAPFFQDGLPTVSPDGNWVAFVSDRDGKWGIWVVPRSGGEPEKILDLSKINTNPSPWGVDERAWMFERISWGR